MKPLRLSLGVLVVGFLSASLLSGQVLISELMSTNRKTTADEDGSYEDWIELRNTGASAVDLAGYGLSDDPALPFKWVFPSRSIAPGEHLVVWASGKDRTGIPEQTGLLRELYLDITGGSVETLEASGNFPSFPDSTGLLTTRFDVPRNVAERYGQRVSGILIPNATGDYEFRISGDDGCRLFLGTNEDPATAIPIAEVPADRWSSPETYTTYASQTSARYTLESGKRYYIAALMKENNGGDHLTVQWRRGTEPREVIPAARFIAKPSALHTNFKIGAGGEPLQLTRPDGSVADQIPAVALPNDVSFGRPDADPGSLAYFQKATRGAANTQPGFTAILGERPEFSQESGFHDSQFQLSLSHSVPGAAIIYTLDGSVPDPANIGGKTYTYANSYPNGPQINGSVSTLTYTAPLTIQDRSPLPNKISQRTTTMPAYGDGSSYLPTTPVFKGTVVRARLVKDGELPGPVVTNTYFVGADSENRYQLPVISISIDEEDLFGYTRGLYTAGKDYDNWRTYSGTNGNGGSPANYKRRGELAEYPAHFEMFEPGQGRAVSRTLSFRMHGGWSRAWPQKSLRFYADRGHDEGDDLDYPLIPGLVGKETGQPVDEFSRFVLRNSGNDHERTRIRDAFIVELSKPLGVDSQGYQPAVHFINGEYWGLINIRERIDRHFIASHHGVDPDKVAILSNNAEVNEGSQLDRDDFIGLRNYIAGNDMSNPSAYSYVGERMDLENFIRYNVAQIYAANSDWPHNNIDCWRVSLGGASGAPGTADGRWRWILFDTDFGFGLQNSASHNTLAHATRLAGDQDWSTVKLRRLLTNVEFRNQFINTFADHMATSFKPSRVNALADSMQAKISSNYTEHRARWRNLGSTSVDPIKTFGSARPSSMRSHLMSQFGLSGTADVTLDTPVASRGSIAINSIVIDGETPGLANPAQPFPWTGTYFLGVPVKVAARPVQGYRFAGWLELPGVTTPEVTLTPGVTPKLTALFEEAPEELLGHYWNFNVPATQLAPTETQIAGAGISVNPGPSTVVESDTGEGFTGANARNGDAAGAHLRVNNPLGAAVVLSLPTASFENIVLQYETRRSNQGAGGQTVEYSLDGTNYTFFESIAVTTTPVLHTFDFTEIPGAADNVSFRVRITFSQGAGGTSGNNRFDNLTVEGSTIPNANQPPVRFAASIHRPVIEGGDAITVDLASLFDDPNDDELTFAVGPGSGTFANASLDGTQLTLSGVLRGEELLTITANDSQLDSLPVTLVLQVHPAAYPLAGGGFAFDYWSPDEPEFIYPEHGLFIQSEVSDPGADEPLQRAYSVGIDHTETDSAGFPYNNTQRTRINGLGGDGISFINTGRGRDVGGLVIALDTRGVSEAGIDFNATTRLVNFRSYALRLQYRIGLDEEFSDVLHEGEPVVYFSDVTDGHSQDYASIPLPEAALEQPYVQVMWRYHYVAGDSGARAEIGLDDVAIYPIAAPPTGFALWQQEQFTDPGDLENAAISGPGADPFGLGVSNLMRYALDIHSAADVAARMPGLERDPSGSINFRFPFDPEKIDVVYRVEASSDLANWAEVLFDSDASGASEPVDGWLTLDGLNTRPTAAPTDFFRLRVMLREESP